MIPLWRKCAAFHDSSLHFALLNQFCVCVCYFSKIFSKFCYDWSNAHYLRFRKLIERVQLFNRSIRFFSCSQQTVRRCNITTRLSIYETSIQSAYPLLPHRTPRQTSNYYSHFQWLLYSSIFIPLHSILSLRCLKLSTHTNRVQWGNGRAQERKYLILFVWVGILVDFLEIFTRNLNSICSTFFSLQSDEFLRTSVSIRYTGITTKVWKITAFASV